MRHEGSCSLLYLYDDVHLVRTIDYLYPVLTIDDVHSLLTINDVQLVLALDDVHSVLTLDNVQLVLRLDCSIFNITTHRRTVSVILLYHISQAI